MVGKYTPVRGVGNPLLSKEALLVSMLRQQGFTLATDTKNYQQVIKPSGEREFVFLFNGMVAINKQTPGAFIADIRAGRVWQSRVHALYNAPESPLRALKSLGGSIQRTDQKAFQKLVEIHEALLKEIKAMPIHVEIHRGARKYWLPATLSAEEIEAEIARLDKCL